MRYLNIPRQPDATLQFRFTIPHLCVPVPFYDCTSPILMVMLPVQTFSVRFHHSTANYLPISSYSSYNSLVLGYIVYREYMRDPNANTGEGPSRSQWGQNCLPQFSQKWYFLSKNCNGQKIFIIEFTTKKLSTNFLICQRNEIRSLPIGR